jgi:DNA-binding response OmpR family regulator
MRVLLIEDDRNLRKILKEELERHSFEVFEADNGKNAIDIFAAIFPDVAILDVGIPFLSGDKLAAEFKHFNKKCRIVAISGSSEKLTIAKSHGADAVLIKPFTAEDLLQVIAPLAKV